MLDKINLRRRITYIKYRYTNRQLLAMALAVILVLVIIAAITVAIVVAVNKSKSNNNTVTEQVVLTFSVAKKSETSVASLGESLQNLIQEEDKTKDVLSKVISKLKAKLDAKTLSITLIPYGEDADKAILGGSSYKNVVNKLDDSFKNAKTLTKDPSQANAVKFVKKQKYNSKVPVKQFFFAPDNSLYSSPDALSRDRREAGADLKNLGNLVLIGLNNDQNMIKDYGLAGSNITVIEDGENNIDQIVDKIVNKQPNTLLMPKTTRVPNTIASSTAPTTAPTPTTTVTPPPEEFTTDYTEESSTDEMVTEGFMEPVF